MKVLFPRLLILFLAVAIVGQVAVSTYLNIKVRSYVGMETPVENAGDEDADNEGFDDLFFQASIKKTIAAVNIKHVYVYSPIQSELNREVIPPPPRA